MVTNSKSNEDIIRLFDTVYGIGKQKIRLLIEKGARTINDLNYNTKYSSFLPESSKKYLKYYDQLQERIPRSEMEKHKVHIKHLIEKHNFKVDIVGSFRRGSETSGDVDVLFTTTTKYVPTTNYIDKFIHALMNGDKNYLLDTLISGKSTLNAIMKYDRSPARRIDVFFSPPDLYSFALLAKTGDLNFNKSIRICIKEKKNRDFILSDKGIRKLENNQYVNVVDPQNFPDVKSIFTFIGIPNREPEEMIGYFSCTDTIDRSSQGSRTRKRSGKSKRSDESSSPGTYKANKKRKTRKRDTSSATSVSPLTEGYSARTRSDYKNTSSYEDDIPYFLSPLTSSYGYYSENDIITETDPGEFYEKWKIRDKGKYDSDETYLSSIGSKYTSRRR
jgi:hypothetical protein